MTRQLTLQEVSQPGAPCKNAGFCGDFGIHALYLKHYNGKCGYLAQNTACPYGCRQKGEIIIYKRFNE